MSDNTAHFNFYLNRQGVTGKQGAKGEKGFSPVISVEKDTLSEYILRITNESSYFLTTNLRESKEDRGGTYIRYDRDQGVMYAGDADRANKTQYGEVRFATPEEITAGDEGTVLSPANVEDILTKYVTTETDQTITGQKDFYKPIKVDQGIQFRGRISARDSINGVKPDIIRYYNASGNILLGEISKYPTDGTNKNVGIEIRQNNIGYDAGLYSCRDNKKYLILDTNNLKAGNNVSFNIDVNGLTINSTGGGVTDAYTKAETDELLDAKQDKLVATTGIEINNNNIGINQKGTSLIEYNNTNRAIGYIEDDVLHQEQNVIDYIEGIAAPIIDIPDNSIRSFDISTVVKLSDYNDIEDNRIIEIGGVGTNAAFFDTHAYNIKHMVRMVYSVNGVSAAYWHETIQDDKYLAVRMTNDGTTLKFFTKVVDTPELPTDWNEWENIPWDLSLYPIEKGDLPAIINIGGEVNKNPANNIISTINIQKGLFYLAQTKIIINNTLFSYTSSNYNDAIATTENYGLVKIDGDSLTVNENYQLQANIPTDVTRQGNTFNGANQLVQLDENSKLPAIDGSQLINLPSSTPANVVTTDTAQTITGQKIFKNSFVSSDGTATTGNRVLISNDSIDLICNTGVAAKINSEGIELRGGIDSSGLSLQSSSQLVVFGQQNTPMRIYASQLERYSNGNDNGAIILDAKNYNTYSNLSVNTLLKVDVTGLSTAITTGTTQNLLDLISLTGSATNIVTTANINASNYNLTGGILKLPYMPTVNNKYTNAYCDYNIDVRITGTIDGSVNTAREFNIELQRASDNSIVETHNVTKTNTNDLTGKGVVFSTYTNTSSDPFIANGLKLVLNNTSGQTVTITGVTLLVKGRTY
jgi:hypothetical protein